MFTLNYFAPSGGEIIPTGWNVIDEDKTYPTLASRNPQIRQSPDSDSMSGYEGINGHNNSDYSETETFRPVANTRMNEESSDDDTGITQIVQPRVSSRFFFNFHPVFLVHYARSNGHLKRCV